MSERDYLYPVRDAWVRPLSPFDNLAADLDATFRAFSRVFASAGSRLTSEEHAQMEDALAELGSTVNALRM